MIAGAAGMFGLDVLRAASAPDRAAASRVRSSTSSTRPRSTPRSQRAAPTALINCAAWTDVDGAEDTSRAGPRGQRRGRGARSRERPRARACRWCTSPATTSSTGARRSAPTARRAPTWSPTPPVRARSTARASSRASSRCWPPRGATWSRARPGCSGPGGRNFAATMLRAAPTSARRVPRCGWSPTSRLPDLDRASGAGAARPAPAGSAGLVHLAGTGRSPGTASPPRSSARPTSTVASSRRAPPRWSAPRRARPGSALESERDDVLPLPPWQDGLAGYLAARAGMIRA